MAELVTDPELLKQLNGDQEVTDPNLLAQLEGQQQPQQPDPSIFSKKTEQDYSDPTQFPNPVSGAYNFGKDILTDTAKDIGYSFGVTKESPGFMGHTREAAMGKSPPPGPLSLRTVSPILIGLAALGEKGQAAADTIAGIIHDVSNIVPVGELARTAGSAVGTGLTSLARKLPGAAPIIHEEAINAARQSPGVLIKGEDPGPLWDQFNQAGKGINLKPTNLMKAIDEAQGMLRESANPDKGLTDFVGNLKSRYSKKPAPKQPAGFVKPTPSQPKDVLESLRNFDADRKDIGQLTGRVQDKGKAEKIADILYSAVYDDLDNLASGIGPGTADADNLLRAIKASKAQFARENYADIIERNISTSVNKFEYIQPNKIKDALRKSKLGERIKNAISPQEWNDINGLIDKLETVAIPPRPGSNFGSGKSTAIGGLVYGLASLLGASPQAAGRIAVTAGAAPYWISRALMTDPGRRFLREASKKQFKMSISEAALLAQGIKAGAQEVNKDAAP